MWNTKNKKRLVIQPKRSRLRDTEKKKKKVVTSGGALQGEGGGGTDYCVRQTQRCIVQHEEYSQYFITIANGN